MGSDHLKYLGLWKIQRYVSFRTLVGYTYRICGVEKRDQGPKAIDYAGEAWDDLVARDVELHFGWHQAHCSLTICAARSAIPYTPLCMCPLTSAGIMLASTTRRPCTP